MLQIIAGFVGSATTTMHAIADMRCSVFRQHFSKDVIKINLIFM